MSGEELESEVLRPLRYYEGMEYVCEKCGRTEEFDGLAIATRSPMRDDADCAICMMNLVDAEAYWNGDVEPTEVKRLV